MNTPMILIFRSGVVSLTLLLTADSGLKKSEFYK